MGHQTIRYTQLFSAYSYDATCLCKKSIFVGKSIIFPVFNYPLIALHSPFNPFPDLSTPFVNILLSLRLFVLLRVSTFFSWESPNWLPIFLKNTTKKTKNIEKSPMRKKQKNTKKTQQFFIGKYEKFKMQFFSIKKS
jgi:hypothetical protein